MAYDHYLKTIFASWWGEMTDARHDGKNADRGELARLRRLELVDYGNGPEPDVTAAFLLNRFQNLQLRINPPLSQEVDLVIAAYVLAHIKTDLPRSTTAALLGGREDEQRVMRESRFLRLIRAQSSGDLFDQARRLAMLLGRAAPVGELGASLYQWRHDPRIRRNWARAYYHFDLAGTEAIPPMPVAPVPATNPAAPGV